MGLHYVYTIFPGSLSILSTDVETKNLGFAWVEACWLGRRGRQGQKNKNFWWSSKTGERKRNNWWALKSSQFFSRGIDKSLSYAAGEAHTLAESPESWSSICSLVSKLWKPSVLHLMKYFKKLANKKQGKYKEVIHRHIILKLAKTKDKNIQIRSALICWGCYKNIIASKWLEQSKFIVAWFGRVKTNQGFTGIVYFWGPQGRNEFCDSFQASSGVLAIFGIPWICLHHMIAAFIFTWHPPCVHVCVQIIPFYKTISYTGLQAYSTSVWTYPN